MGTRPIIVLAVSTIVFAASSRAGAVCGWDEVIGERGADGIVRALVAFDVDNDGQDEIIVGGAFTQLGPNDGPLVPITAKNVAMWDPVSAQWAALGEGLPGGVFALAVYGGVLYAGGKFKWPDGPLICKGQFCFSEPGPEAVLAKWDAVEGQWVPVPGASFGLARSLVEFQGWLYVGGRGAIAQPGALQRWLVRRRGRCFGSGQR